MGSRSVGIADTPPGTTVAEIDVLERGSQDIATTLTADPGVGGTTLAVTSAARFPPTPNYKVRVDNEVMAVTGGAGTTSWTVTRGVDGTTAVAHAIGAAVGQVVGVQRVQPVTDRMVTAQWIVAAFRTLGTAATGQNLFAISNAANSNTLVAIRKLRLEMDATAVLTAVSLDVKAGRTTALPSGGTTLTKTLLDTTKTANANVVARGATASDGGAATAITASLSSTAWHQYAMRMHTLVGQVLPDDWNLIPDACIDNPIVLQPNQGFAIQIVGTASSNPATNHYVVKAFCEEFVQA